jgi:4-amino-4-deoxy-L-arabinose transferase-like glycosyltransferase
MQVLSMKIFGVNEFAARFPNAIIGILTLIIIYSIGKKLFDKSFGFIWAFVYFGSILPFVYFKSGIIDPFFNLFIFLGIYFLINYSWRRENSEKKGFLPKPIWTLILSGVFIGMAMLSKGPVAFLVIIIVVGIYWIWNKFKLPVSIPQLVLFSLVSAAVICTWFGLETLKNGPGFFLEFIKYQYRLFSTPDAGHGGFPGYHIVVLFFGCFPASIFAIRGFYKLKPGDPYQQIFRKWMIILFWVVLVLFTIVRSKIVHYSSLAYFPVTFLASLTIYEIIQKRIIFYRWMKSVLVLVTILFSLAIIAVFVLAKNMDVVRNIFADNVFALANLEAKVNWPIWVIIPAILLLVVMILFLTISRKSFFKGIIVLFTGVAFTVFIGLICFIGRIEMYTQNAHVEMAQRLVGKDAYVKTSGFKSYVHLFYSKIKPHDNPNATDKQWLVWEEVDKDVYIITKKHHESYWQGVNTMEKVADKNGFLMYRRIR